MIKTSSLKNISVILFGIVIFLLILNISVSKFIEKDDQPKNREPILSNEIDSLFRTALDNFGFSKNWIVKRKLRNVTGDSLKFTYSVSVPNDVSIHLILVELKKIFWDYDLEIDAEEIASNKKNLVKLRSETYLKLAAELYYDDDAKREFGTISFLIKDLPLESEEALTKFLNTPELFYVVLIPKELSKKSLSVLNKVGKRYALLLDDSIDELNYKLSSGYSDDKIKKSIKEIVGTFYNSAFFIIDDKSDLYESEKFPLIKSELEKRGIVIVRTSELSQLIKSKVSPEDNFQDFIKTLKRATKRFC